jgi:hypothetical protein
MEETAMNGKGVKLLLLVGLVGALGAGRPMPAEAQAAQVLRVPFVSMDLNECSGEEVLTQGELLLVVRSASDGNGGSHFVFNGTVVGRAIGETSGAEYLISSAFGFNVNTSGAGTLTFTSAQSGVGIGQGTTPNSVFHALTHLTILANGTVTASIDHFSFECH